MRWFKRTGYNLAGGCIKIKPACKDLPDLAVGLGMHLAEMLGIAKSVGRSPCGGDPDVLAGVYRGLLLSDLVLSQGQGGPTRRRWRGSTR